MKKKNPTGGMDVCVVFVVRTVIWNVKWHEGRKDLNSTKMDQREKNGTGKKKKSGLGHVCQSVVSVVCCQVEVCATSWSLVQRSPTDCGVSECDREASTKNEETQAYIGLSRHRGGGEKKTTYVDTALQNCTLSPAQC
jgi:hypothetical protein